MQNKGLMQRKVNKMKPVITVRRYEDSDRYAVQEVVRDFVLSRFSAAFWFCLFREVSDKYFEFLHKLNTDCYSHERSLCS